MKSFCDCLFLIVLVAFLFAPLGLNGQVVFCDNSFYDPGGPSGNYSSNTVNDFTVICPSSPTDTVVVTFTSFDVGTTGIDDCADDLQIFEDLNGDQLVDAGDYQFPGGQDNTTDGFCGNSPADLTDNGVFVASAAGNCLLFIFNSGVNSLPGWEATVTCDVPDPPPAVSCPNTFYDSNGLTGVTPPDAYEFTVICPSSPTELVVVTFNDFDVEDANNASVGCWDYLQVFEDMNGNHLVDVFVDNQFPGGQDVGTGGFCGDDISALPNGGVFAASAPGNCLLFEFDSDFGVTGFGWDATVTCITPPCNYATNGSASSPGDDCCYELTPDSQNQTGAVWNPEMIDLTCDFTWEGTVNFGDNSNTGGEGIGFVFQNSGPNVTGSSPLGMGGISPSLCIEFDTKENNCNGSGVGDDPNGPASGSPSNNCCNPPFGTGDHWDLYQNGDPFNDLLMAMCFLNGSTGLSIDDGTDHPLEVIWNSGTQTLTVVLDGATLFAYTGDIVTNIFGGNPMVYYGFTARTSDSPADNTNQQSFCETSVISDAGCCSVTPGFMD